jgi:DNA (cytosine-5)-methyltransferase 1
LKKRISVIDLFAGPGGLGEGFYKYKSGKKFGPTVSIEMDKSACETLKLRKLFRMLNARDKKKYYEIIRINKRISWNEIKKVFNNYQNQIDASVWNHELGSKTFTEKETIKEIKRRLDNLGHRKNDPLIIIGGPPCQAYSLIGRASRKQMKVRGDYTPEEDHRHFLYQWYLNIIPEFKPEVFIMENVPGILSSEINGKRIFETILEDLRGLGYELHSLKADQQTDLFNDNKDFKLKASDYGVAQDRQRVIIMGVRKDVAKNKKIPALSNSDLNNVASILSDLPPLRSGLSKIDKKNTKDGMDHWKDQLRQKHWNGFEGIEDDLRRELKKTIKSIQIEEFTHNRGGTYVTDSNYGKSNSMSSELSDWYVDENLGGYLNHESRSHMDCDLRRYLFNSVFTKVRGKPPLLGDYPRFLLPDHKNKESGNHKDRFRTIDGRKPSKTVTSHISKDGHAFIHFDPQQCRSLTVREAARIQSFPDNYFFCGNRTQQYHQVGNAVPPYLAFQIARVVDEVLN